MARRVGDQTPDRIPSEVSTALAAVDTIVVVWSENAANSRWVDAELASALARELSDGSLRIIPVRLDHAPMPTLLQPISWIEAENEDAVGVARCKVLDVLRRGQRAVNL